MAAPERVPPEAVEIIIHETYESFPLGVDILSWISSRSRYPENEDFDTHVSGCTRHYINVDMGDKPQGSTTRSISLVDRRPIGFSPRKGSVSCGGATSRSF